MVVNTVVVGIFSPLFSISVQENVYNRKEGNVLFNDALKFYLRINGIILVVKDHSDSERGNLLPPLYGLLSLINSKGSYTYTILHTTAFVTPVVEDWLEQEIAIGID